MKKTSPKIMSIDEILGLNLIIPYYQRPYKWNSNNITDLILDIRNSVEESQKYEHFKYRIGTIILFKNKENQYEIVDGQQRILSLLLMKLYLQPDFSCSLLENRFTNKITQKHLHDNYRSIQEWFTSLINENEKIYFIRALKNILEVVVIIVTKLNEAFQLFDSQNSRGRALYPHDLLKAYHLREIKDKYEMQNAVIKWEIKKPSLIRELFDRYLFPIWNWSKCRKSVDFTASQIDIYKGIEEVSGYTYAKRANKAMPYFLLTEPFIAGGDFFEMVDHYMKMLTNIKEEIITNKAFLDIKTILLFGNLEDKDKSNEIVTVEDFDKIKSPEGLTHARNLFLCSLLCYYDRFHNFDLMAVKKLFSWAMMIRVDMQHLGFDTINRYAIGIGDPNVYSNIVPVISMITSARRHTEISGLKINLQKERIASDKWIKLYNNLCQINGYK